MPPIDADPMPSDDRRAPAAIRFIDRSLIAYALAGGAVVAAATTADAAIVTSGIINLNVGSFGSPLLNIGGNGGAGAVGGTYGGDGGNGGVGGIFGASGGNGGVGGSIGGNGGSGGLFGWDHDSVNDHSVIGMKAAVGSTLEFAQAAPGLAYRFALGASAGGNGGTGGFAYSGGPTGLAAYDVTNTFVSGLGHQWAAGGTGYVGFRFLDASSTYLYGWIEFMVPTTAAAGEQVTLVRWAYQDEPNGVLRAGMTAIPLPGAAALAAFAAGALGVGGGRRGRLRTG